MKNVQAIDGAQSRTFSICQTTSVAFAQVFPGDGQGIELAGGWSSRLGKAAASSLLALVREHPLRKPDVVGLHGTLFFQLGKQRRYFPGSKRERDRDPSALNRAQRQPYGEWTGRLSKVP